MKILKLFHAFCNTLKNPAFTEMECPYLEVTSLIAFFKDRSYIMWILLSASMEAGSGLCYDTALHKEYILINNYSSELANNIPNIAEAIKYKSTL